MAMRQFKAESKRLLDLMINSIYTNKEIFLRELISNASDAIDKLYFRSLVDDSVNLSRDDFEIFISIDKDARTLTISDNGCGMTREELAENLGTIAKSGSLNFDKENESDDIDIIGQFGVGFYSSFMVAEKVTVISRAFGSEEAWRWQSSGPEGYTLTPAERSAAGTDVILKIKENTEGEIYEGYTDPARIKSLVKKYSDYIRYPIKMEESTRKKLPDSDKYETVTEINTINAMVPIWKRPKSEITEEEYADFYRLKYRDFLAPQKVIHFSTEGVSTYSALVFIPSKPPFDYYSQEFKKGLQLYSSGVLIMDSCSELLPDYFSFVRGLVDSEDLSLNISREMLQHDRQLKSIEKSLERKIKSELTKMLENERSEYETFFKNFGSQIKYALHTSYGSLRDQLQDLLLFYSAKQKKMITLSEYVASMQEGQDYIYYACGSDSEKMADLPQTERVLEQGYDILFLTDMVDEFAVRALRTYNEKEFRSVSSGGIFVGDMAEQQELFNEQTANSGLCSMMKNALGDEVYQVRLSNRMKKHPVCLTTEGEISLEMEKIINSVPQANQLKAQRVLEININHPIFETLKKLYESGDGTTLETYTKILYAQSLLIEGMPVNDPAALSLDVCDALVAAQANRSTLASEAPSQEENSGSDDTSAEE